MHSVAWSDVTPELALVDYDVVVFDLTSWPERGGKLPEVRDIARVVMRPDARIVVVGHPRTVLNARGVFHACQMLPVFPQVTAASGGRTLRSSDEYASYLDDHVEGYEFFVEPAATTRAQVVSDAYAKVATPGDNVLPRCSVDAITTTARGEPTAMRLTVEFVRTQPKAVKTEPVVVGRSSPVAWLPPPRAPDDERTWYALLQDLGIIVSIAAPAWATACRTPDHAIAIEAAAEARRHLEEAQAAAQAKEAAEQHASRFIKLLYEEGEALEEIVWEALEFLGGTVQRPTKREGDDGRLLLGDQRAVLEIKGKKAFVTKDNLAQLAQFVVAAVAEDDSATPWKGVLVANAHNKVPPSERREPFTGAPCQKVVEHSKLAVLTTTQIFDAVCQQQRGAFKADAFWEAVMTTVGLVRWP